MALCQADGCNNTTCKDNGKSFFFITNCRRTEQNLLIANNRMVKLPKKLFTCSDQFFDEKFLMLTGNCKSLPYFLIKNK